LKILYLYYDLMNLYGDVGNIRILENYFKGLNLEIIIDKKSLREEINFDNYDLIYIGSGSEDNLKVILQDLLKYKNILKKIIDNGKIFLCTGNSFEVFGKKIYSGNEVYKGLEIFDFEVKENFKKRVACDIIYECNFCEGLITGCVNKCSEIFNIKKEDSLFKVKSGTGDFDKSEFEGINYLNFFGTHVTGPILVRNLNFLEKLSKIILLNLGIML